MKNKLLKRADKILIPTKKVVGTAHGPIILFGYITDPPGGGGGGGGGESTSDGLVGTLPSGNLCSDDQTQVGTAFWAPPITSFVRFTAYGGAAITPYVTVQTRSLGNYKTVAGFVPILTYRTFDVDIYPSNVSVSIYFQTSDTNGGCVHWQAMHR